MKMNQLVKTIIGAVLTVVLYAGAHQASAQDGTDVRAEFLAAPLTSDLGGSGTRDRADDQAFKQLMSNATPPMRPGFIFGQQTFQIEWQRALGPQPTVDGLGPVFNRDGCHQCHVNNGRGRPPDTAGAPFESILVRLSVPGPGPNGGPNPVPSYGGQLQDRALEGVPAEGRAIITYEETAGTYMDGTAYSLRRPRITFTDLGFGELPDDLLTSARVANQLVGLGLLDAVSDDTLFALADPEDSDGDGISGEVNLVWDAIDQREAVGRFGWKANVPTLKQQTAGASLGDMGVTTPVFPIDNCEPPQTACIEAAAMHASDVEMPDAFLDRLVLYTSLVAVPRQRDSDLPEVKQGEDLFRQIGCAACHMPTLKTATHPVFQELSDQVIHPFTDLLVHDMGEGLADDRPDFTASGREWRTAPLWGIGLVEVVSGHNLYLHDGRARGLEEAILWHGSEAAPARDAFRSLDEASRTKLIAFLKSL